MANGIVVVLFGPNGCGKDTQARFLVKDFDFAHISTGKICRESRDPQILETIAKGKRIDDSKMLNLLIEHESFNASRVIINGFPRTRFQVRMLHNALGGRKPIFLRLHTTREIAEQRICSRFENGKANGQIRPDDNFAIARQRLDDYFQEERLICPKVIELWDFVNISNDGTPDDVFGLIKTALIDRGVELAHFHNDMSLFETHFAFSHLTPIGDPTRIFC